MNITVKDDIKQLTRRLTNIQRQQIPFATSQALNDVAYKARENTKTAARRDLDQPTPWTVNGVRYKKSNKRNLTAQIFYLADRWEVLKYQVQGGTRQPRNKAILVPTKHVKRNKYGNVTRANRKRLFARGDTFSGEINFISGGTARGLFQRIGRNRIKQLFIYAGATRYKKQRFKYADSVDETVKKEFPKAFATRMTRALQTAR